MKKHYHRIQDPERFEIVRLYEQGIAICEIATRIGCNYENVKLICKIFRETGRVRLIPSRIKRFFPLLENDPEALRAKMSESRFEAVRQAWLEVWNEDQNDGLPVLPPVSEYARIPPGEFVSLKFDHIDPGLIQYMAGIDLKPTDNDGQLNNVWFYDALAQAV